MEQVEATSSKVDKSPIKKPKESSNPFAEALEVFEQFQSPQKSTAKTDTKQDFDHLALVPFIDKSVAASPPKTYTNQANKRHLELAKASFDLGADDLQTLAFALQEKAPAEKQHDSTPKKHRAKDKQKSPKIPNTFKREHSKSMLQHKSSGAEMKEEAKGSQQTSTHAKKRNKLDPKTWKSTFKHRKTSSAYHSARNAAKKAGDSPNTCKMKAKQAAQQVSALIDAGVMKE